MHTCVSTLAGELTTPAPQILERIRKRCSDAETAEEEGHSVGSQRKGARIHFKGKRCREAKAVKGAAATKGAATAAAAAAVAAVA